MVGRPFEVDSDLIETLIENKQHSTIQETADVLKVTGESEKCAFFFFLFFFTGKNPPDFLANPLSLHN